MPRRATNKEQPATKADVAKAIDELAVSTQKGFHYVDQRFDVVEQDIKDIKQDITGLKQDVVSLQKGQEAILAVVKSIDQQLKTHKDLPARVARLERAIFR